MKNNNLHEFIEAFDIEAPTTPAHQAYIKQSLSRGAGTHHKKETFMKRNKKLIGASTVGLTLAMVGSVLVYSYHYSPHALADQLASQGIVSLESLSPDKMTSLQTKLGTDPSEALKEAKAAKDLKIITKTEFDDESKNATGVFATSLSNDPNSPSFSMQSVRGPGAGESGTVGMSVKGQTESGTMSASAGTATVSSDDKSFNVEYSGESTVRASGGQVNMVHMERGKTTTDAPNAGPVRLHQFPMAEASSYLRYTDKNGRVNVLSLDKAGLPVFRTIFMSGNDTNKL